MSGLRRLVAYLVVGGLVGAVVGLAAAILSPPRDWDGTVIIHRSDGSAARCTMKPGEWPSEQSDCTEIKPRTITFQFKSCPENGQLTGVNLPVPRPSRSRIAQL